MEHTHAIILRRHEEDTDSDKFSLFKTTPGVLEAMNDVDEIVGIPEDIYYVCDLAAVSDVTNKFNFVYVIGYNCTTPRIVSKEWRDQSIGLELSIPQIWDGNRVSAADMAWGAGHFGVSKDVLFMAMVECLEFAIKEVGLSSVTQEAKEAYNNVILYASKKINVGRFVELTSEYRRQVESVDYISMRYAILHCSELAFSKYTSANAYDAMVNIADVLYGKGEADLIAILRNRIPLRKLLIASLGV